MKRETAASILEQDLDLVRRDMRPILRQTTHLPQFALAVHLAQIGLKGIKEITGHADNVISFAQAVAADDPSVRTQSSRKVKARAINAVLVKHGMDNLRDQRLLLQLALSGLLVHQTADEITAYIAAQLPALSRRLKRNMSAYASHTPNQ
jgi:hypothetical protein